MLLPSVTILPPWVGVWQLVQVFLPVWEGGGQLLVRCQEQVHQAQGWGWAGISRGSVPAEHCAWYYYRVSWSKFTSILIKAPRISWLHVSLAPRIRREKEAGNGSMEVLGPGAGRRIRGTRRRTAWRWPWSPTSRGSTWLPGLGLIVRKSCPEALSVLSRKARRIIWLAKHSNQCTYRRQEVSPRNFLHWNSTYWTQFKEI